MRPRGHHFGRYRELYLMLVPGILFFLVFRYGPMLGLTLAFKEFQPFLGLWKSPWVKWEQFERLLTDPVFPLLFRNTLIIGLYNISFIFPVTIVFALMLNESASGWIRRGAQTLTYIPHFMSWVVVVGISYVLFTTEGGVVNNILAGLGLEKVNFLLSEEWFRPMIVAQILWRDGGWGTILILAALAGIDLQLYEAAQMDGAGRLQRLVSITLPGIRSTIVIILILRLGAFLDTGFDQIYNMLNAMNRNVGEVFDTYVYTSGLEQGQYSYATAVGLFKSVIGFVLVLVSNTVSRRLGEEGVF